jgi:hypothetical protein
MTDEVTEAECLVCRRWPAAERGEERVKYFSKGKGEVLLVPVHDICPACELAFFEAKSATKH